MNPATPKRDSLPAEDAGTYTEEAVLEELERVLSSAEVRSSERASQFLRFVVEETLADRADAIKAYTIAVDCFDRDDDFDPQIDPYVRIVARRLRRALMRYYEIDGAEDPIRIEIPKGSYVPEFLANEPGTAAAGQSGEAVRRRGGVLTADKGRVSQPRMRGAGPTAVAVVRFETHGEGPGQEYLGSGLTEELMVDLTSFAEIEVVGPLPVCGPDGHHTSPAELGSGNDADFVLWGKVHKLDNRLRVVANLTEVASRATIWAERYERDLTVSNLFVVQDEISQSVAATIGDATGVIVRKLAERSLGKRPDSLTSYEAVLRGFHWGMVMTEEAFDDAYEALQRAVENDPEYALSKALLSDIYFSDWLSAVGTFEDGLDLAEELAREALASDATCVDAHWAMGQVHYGRRRFDEFAEHFETALELNPNRALHIAGYALYLVGLRQWEKAMELVDRAFRLNPYHPSWYHLIPVMNHARQGMWLEALQDARRVRAPGFMWGPLLRAAALGHLDRAEEAERHLQDLAELQPEFSVRGHEAISRLLYADENVDLILQGIEKTGLRVLA